MEAKREAVSYRTKLEIAEENSKRDIQKSKESHQV